MMYLSWFTIFNGMSLILFFLITSETSWCFGKKLMNWNWSIQRCFFLLGFGDDFCFPSFGAGLNGLNSIHHLFFCGALKSDVFLCWFLSACLDAMWKNRQGDMNMANPYLEDGLSWMLDRAPTINKSPKYRVIPFPCGRTPRLINGF